jgi:nucleotide-binding universal stress UspA family protein
VLDAQAGGSRMEAFKNILVPTDFSPTSKRALVLGADLARRYDAALTLVHVYDPLPYALPEGAWGYTPEQQAHHASELERALAAAKRDAEIAGARRVETSLLQGRPAATIVEFAHATSSDLVVMGSHGRTGVQRIVPGSVAEKVLRLVDCSVVIARPPLSPTKDPRC